MPDLIAIAYVSSAARLLEAAELESLLLSARAHNSRLRITGTLLYDEGSFFQYLEGPSASVADVYGRIRTSTLHHGLIELLRRPVEQRRFDGWHMGFAHAPKSLLLELAQASWMQELSRRAGEDEAGGVKLLLHFWESATRRR